MRWWRSVGGGIVGGLLGIVVYGVSVEWLPLKGCQETPGQLLVWLGGGAAVSAAAAVRLGRSSSWRLRATAIGLALVLAVPFAAVVYVGATMALGDAGFRACPPR